MCAGLAAAQAGAEVLILERDETALGTTAMLTGLIPAAGSALQKAAPTPGTDHEPFQRVGLPRFIECN